MASYKAQVIKNDFIYKNWYKGSMKKRKPSKVENKHFALN